MMRFERRKGAFNQDILFVRDDDGHAVKRFEFDYDDHYFYVYTYQLTSYDPDIRPIRKFRRYRDAAHPGCSICARRRFESNGE